MFFPHGNDNNLPRRCLRRIRSWTAWGHPLAPPAMEIPEHQLETIWKYGIFGYILQHLLYEWRFLAGKKTSPARKLLINYLVHWGIASPHLPSWSWHLICFGPSPLPKGEAPRTPFQTALRILPLIGWHLFLLVRFTCCWMGYGWVAGIIINRYYK